MRAVKEFTYSIIDKLGFKRENVVPFLLAVPVAILFLLDQNYFDNHLLLLMWIVIGVAASVVIAWIFMLAGFTVLRALFLLNAEISLMIFLAQAYCGVQAVASPSDDALRTLIFLGVVYIGYEFFKALKKALEVRLDSIPEKKWSWEKVMVVSLFALFTLAFLYSIYQVTEPIVSNMCVYQR
ncbi:MAG: hypothetical protein RJA61_187 [Candidatus Parcubacteria bacterium]|jgi:hypothetical protein